MVMYISWHCTSEVCNLLFAFIQSYKLRDWLESQKKLDFKQSWDSKTVKLWRWTNALCYGYRATGLLAGEQDVVARMRLLPKGSCLNSGTPAARSVWEGLGDWYCRRRCVNGVDSDVSKAHTILSFLSAPWLLSQQYELSAYLLPHHDNHRPLKF